MFGTFVEDNDDVVEGFQFLFQKHFEAFAFCGVSDIGIPLEIHVVHEHFHQCSRLGGFRASQCMFQAVATGRTEFVEQESDHGHVTGLLMRSAGFLFSDEDETPVDVDALFDLTEDVANLLDCPVDILRRRETVEVLEERRGATVDDGGYVFEKT